MTSPTATEPSARPTVDDCWNRIGVRGDGTCGELTQHVHCRNCPVYAHAAGDLLDVELPPDYLANWTAHVARPKPVLETARLAVVVFRIGDEWLALPSALFQEIANPGSIHSMPHRRQGGVLGLVNVRGELLACVSLRAVLHLPDAPAPAAGGRFMVIQREGHRLVCPVDELHGVARFSEQQPLPVPATLAKAAATYTLALLPWQQKTLGLLDDQLLFYTINRSLA